MQGQLVQPIFGVCMLALCEVHARRYDLAAMYVHIKFGGWVHALTACVAALQVSVLSYFSNQLRKQLLQQTERSAQLELQLLQQEAQQLKLMHQQEDAATRQCMAAAAAASAALQQVLADLRQVMSGEDTPGDESTAAAESVHSSRGEAVAGIAEDAAAAASAAVCNSGQVDGCGVLSSCVANSSTSSNYEAGVGSTAAGPGEQQAAGRKRSNWLHTAVNTMIGNLHSAAADALARAELIASRQEIAVQSDETQQMDWLRFVTSAPASAITHQLHEKAVAEAIVRIYIRGLHQLEASWVHELQQRQGRPNSSRPVGSAGLDPAAGGVGGGVSTLFEAMVGHYSQQQQQHGQHKAWQVYDASLWKDPQVCHMHSAG
jgi:hypothetical protein